MNHDPLCLDGLTDEEREAVVSGIDAAECQFCILIAKVRADTLDKVEESVRAASDLERRFLENASLQASIEYAQQHPEQRVGRRPRP